MSGKLAHRRYASEGKGEDEGEGEGTMRKAWRQMDMTEPTWLDLYDYRLRIAALYAERAAALRAGEDDAAVLARFRAGKDELFRRHPQSALAPADRAHFAGLRYFPYDPALRVESEMTPLAQVSDAELPASGPHAIPFRRAARLRFTVAGTPGELLVYWIDVYGGGLFVPFRDATCADESYGGGRYLFDTVKGSDFIRLDGNRGGGDGNGDSMGYAGGRIVLDFNYAYNPSCAYDARWVCPLAPNENRLPMPIRAGERKYHQD